MARLIFNTRYKPPKRSERPERWADTVALYGIKEMELLGRIGHSGSKVHRLRVFYVDTPEGMGIWKVYSHCGSAKWSLYGESRLIPLESSDLSLVTCDHCRGIRVPGGKTPPPSSHRIPIDPDTRPKRYYFKYKVDFTPYPDRPPGIGYLEEGDVRAMSAEEARDKIEKRLNTSIRTGNSFYTRVYDFELDRIYDWRDKLIWRREK